jgi:arginyl-tRNA synthetase
LKSVIESLLHRAVDALPPSVLSPAERGIDIEVKRTRDAQHGDFASNLAMRLATAARRNPRQLAEALARALPPDPAVDKVEVAASGFINFFLTDVAYHAEIARILADPRIPPRVGPRRAVELVFPSAAHPLHADQGRHAAFAATLANLLEAAGHPVERECSVHGEERPMEAGHDAVLAGWRSDLEHLGVVFGSRRSDPRELHAETRRLRVCGASPPGALRAARIGPPDATELRTVAPVSFLRGARKTAARPGASVALRALLEEIGSDAARLFFVMRSHEQHLEFDLDLARERSNDNPLYCIQYAHARVSSVQRQLADRGLAYDRAGGLASLAGLAGPEARSLIRRLGAFKETVEHGAHERAPHGLVHYLVSLAGDFHAYHRAHPLIVDDAAVRDARLTLACAAQLVIKRGLGLLGASAPDTM